MIALMVARLQWNNIHHTFPTLGGWGFSEYGTESVWWDQTTSVARQLTFEITLKKREDWPGQDANITGGTELSNGKTIADVCLETN